MDIKNIYSQLKPESRKIIVEICVRAMLRKQAQEQKQKAVAVGQ